MRLPPYFFMITLLISSSYSYSDTNPANMQLLSEKALIEIEKHKLTVQADIEKKKLEERTKESHWSFFDTMAYGGMTAMGVYLLLRIFDLADKNPK